MNKRNYYVYIATNQRNTVFYVGITNNIERRMFEHAAGTNASFTKKYNINKLLYFIQLDNPEEAIALEKKLKGWKRERKMNLVKEKNPDLKDLLEL